MSSNTIDDCCICFDPLASNSPLLTLSCQHKFHLLCLATSIQTQNKECPLCRATIDAAVVQLLTKSTPAPSPVRPQTLINLTVQSTPPMEDPIDEAAVRALSDRLTAANANVNDHPLIIVSTALEYGAQKSDEESNIYGLVTLQAPSAVASSDAESSSGISRVPIDLVCVVDQSGSMGGEKLRLLKETLIYITEQLNDFDRLAIISFDTTAYDCSHGLKRMNQQNRGTIIRAINHNISAQGGTYIGSGLQMAIDMFIRRQTKNPVGALLLLTDGQDNETSDYSQLMRTLPEGVMCHTFGYGSDHTASLLVQLAEQGNGGTFTYVDQQQAVGPAFAIALGGLFSCVAQQLRVQIEFTDQYNITHVHSKYPYEPENLPSNKLTWKLNDLNADEKRNLVFQLHVPKVNHVQDIEMNSQQTCFNEDSIGQVTVTYLEPNDSQSRTTSPVCFELIRTAQPAANLLQVNYTLDIQRNRVETAREIKRAMDEYDYQRSLAILKAQVNKIKASVSAQDPFCQSLIQDLEHRYPSERDYRSSHNNTYMQHSSERGTYAPTSAFSSARYQSPQQQQQMFHFQQQQQLPPPYIQQQQLPPPYIQQQQLPPPYIQQQQLHPPCVQRPQRWSPYSRPPPQSPSSSQTNHERSSPFFGNTRHIYCDHSTIEFNPNSNNINEYELHYGHIQNLTILAYAEDEHGQTILVHSITTNDNHPSVNQYPHVTISVSNIPPYSAVYSNDLWKRLVDNDIIEVNLDEYDKPRSISMKDQSREWNGKLNSDQQYEETQAYVKIVDKSFDLHGIVCLDNIWKNDKCQGKLKI